MTSIWRRCVNQVTSWASGTRKRVVREGRWQCSAEQLETRQMLSAVSIEAPEIGEVARAKMPVQYPNVAGTWDVAIVGASNATATLTQKGTKVTVAYNLPVIGHIELSGHFSKNSTHSLTAKRPLKLPEVGKVNVNFTITFPDVNQPTTFTATAILTAKTLPQPIQYSLSGTKQLSMGQNSLKQVDRAAMLPTLSENWALTATQGGISIPGDLTFSQSGKGGKHVTGVVHIDAAVINISANLKPNVKALEGPAKSVAVAGARAERGRFDIVFFDNYTTFTGTATFKKLNQTIALNGEVSQGS